MSGSKQPLPADRIRRQLDRILASNVFASSQRMKELLAYLVAESLRDGRPRIKELAIGMAVFGRDESFDPRIDAVVRVEVGRLRGKLREYYAGTGADDPVRIEVPKGAYLPVFTPAPGNAGLPVRQTGSRSWPGFIGVGLLVLTVVGVTLFAEFRSSEPLVSERGAPPFSVAVLPLSDWTGQSDDYFSEAMTDVLISALSKRPELRVTSLSSVMIYKGTGLQPSQIAEQLGVGSIVDGTVFREADRVRITANLIDVKENRNVWSNTFNKPMTGVLALQEEVASEIARELVGEILPKSAPSEREINPQAYEAFLKGAYWRNRLTAEGFNRGVLFFQQAIELQPDYAEAYAAMAACHCRLAGHGVEVVRPDIALPQATLLASKALELNDSLAEPYAVLGIIKFKYEWDADASMAYLERALRQNPSLFEAHLWVSQVAEGTGRQELAVEHARQALRVNPLSLAANLNLGWQLFQAGQITDAENQFDKLLEFDPEFWGGHWGKGHIELDRRSYQDAISEFLRAVELEGGHTLPQASLGYAYAISGYSDEALAVIEELQEMSQSVYVSPVHMAMIYAGLDETDAAFEWLDKALAVRARSMAWLTVRREFNILHGDPRYDALVTAIGIAGRSLD